MVDLVASGPDVSLDGQGSPGTLQRRGGRCKILLWALRRGAGPNPAFLLPAPFSRDGEGACPDALVCCSGLILLADIGLGVLPEAEIEKGGSGAA